MRIKTFFIALLALLLILPSFLIPTAANEDDSSEEEEISTAESGSIAAKDEVIYANLSATGNLENIYVVNIFDLAREGTIVDYGTYSTLKNLTDLSFLKQGSDTVHFTSSEDKFYYQGNLDEGKIPWNIDISYFLNGDKIDPNLLAGEEGSFQMEITTSANEAVDSSFYENFMLQISVELNADVFDDIHVPQATIANVGKNKQITFTVMPGEDESLILEANVNDFEFAGVQIAAIPFNMQIDIPDTDNMTEDMTTLADAIEQLNEGVATLKTGVSDLNKGVGEIKSGSSEYNTNMNRVASSSEDLTSASKEIQGALEYIAGSLDEGLEGGAELGQLGDLANGLSDFSVAIVLIGNNLANLKGGINTLLDNLGSLIESIPVFPEDELQEIEENYKENQEILELINAQRASQSIRNNILNELLPNYEELNESFDEIIPRLNGIGHYLNEMADGLDVMLKNLDLESPLMELENGLSELSSNYGDFHDGLVSYTGGVSQLASGYSELHSGFAQLHNGTKELEDGVAELHDGTRELRDGTKEMPEQMQEEIDEMLADFDYSDYRPVSFVSDKNKHIQSVQFVIQTEGIEMMEEDVAVEIDEKERKSFWTLFLDLFR